VQESAAPIDGRAARAVRTREAIVDATVALVEEGDLRPTAPRIAERAGVSVRSVFQHFDDLPALHTAVVHRVVERLAKLVVPVDPALPLGARVASFVSHRGALLDAVTPFRRAAAVHGPFAPEIREALARGNAYLRDEVTDAFAGELAAAPEAERGELADAMAAATSWPMWDALRVEGGHGPDRARATIARLLRSLLSAVGDSAGPPSSDGR
jgi:TetR/AcrR family transcriptional regulator, regulator of autoinduction and epiphytic fitness